MCRPGLWAHDRTMTRVLAREDNDFERKEHSMSSRSPSSLAETRLSRRSAARLLGGTGAAALAVHRIHRHSALANVAAEPFVPSTYEGTITMSQAAPTNDLTVVLVHGAFADSSGWNAVIELLQEAGVTVATVPNELRGVANDSAYVASALNQMPGPVLLVGHSYGGVVISNAGSMASNVVGLVYVAGFATDEGETLGSLETDSKDSVLVSALIPRQYPTGAGSDGTATEFLIDPARVQEAFAADLSWGETAVIAATQRPISEFCFSEPTQSPAWKSLPTWSIVPTGDKAAGTDVLQFTAERAGATTVELDGSHVIMISQPKAVTDVILSAIASVS